MKKLFTFLFILVSVFSYSQSFNGVNISGNVTKTIEELKSKGFSYVKKVDEVNVYELEGIVNSEQVELYVYYTPATNLTAKFVIFFPEKSSFNSLLEDYNKYSDILSTKYGNASKKQYFFLSPYEKGDGYELQAIKNDKGFVSSFWFSINNCSMSVSISKYAQLKITYENDANMGILEQEIKNKNLTTF
jgi:hypothetical protein